MVERLQGSGMRKLSHHQQQESKFGFFQFPRLSWAVSIPVVTSVLGISSANAQFLPPPQPLPVPPPQQMNTPVTTSEDYLLGVGDRIQMDVFNVPEYSGQNGKHQVSVDGALNLPLVGSIPVQGMTIEQATEAVKQQYAQYLQRPLITLTLMSARPMQIAISGEIQRPGSYSFSTSGNAANGAIAAGVSNSSSLNLPRVTQLLQMAGGVTALADIRQIQIRRTQPGSPFEQVISINLWELLHSGDLNQDVTLRDGDTVYIPTVTDLDRMEARQVAASNFASQTTQPISVAVVGQVNRPGTHTLTAEVAPTVDSSNSAGMTMPSFPDSIGVFTVTKAIKIAGGITASADIRQIEVRRISRTGTEQTISVDLWALLQEGDLTQDVMLQQGDTIVIPEAKETAFTQSDNIATASFSPDTVKINVVGEVIKPGPIDLPPNTSLNQAIMAAGGFNQSRAKTKSVELIRLNPNGSVSRQTIPVNVTAEVNDQTNPILRPNDVVVVGRSGSAAFRDNFGGAMGALNPLNGLMGVLRFVGILD